MNPADQPFYGLFEDQEANSVQGETGGPPVGDQAPSIESHASAASNRPLLGPHQPYSSKSEKTKLKRRSMLSAAPRTDISPTLLPSTFNFLSHDERRELVKRQAKLSKLLGDEVIPQINAGEQQPRYSVSEIPMSQIGNSPQRVTDQKHPASSSHRSAELSDDINADTLITPAVMSAKGASSSTTGGKLEYDQSDTTGRGEQHISDKAARVLGIISPTTVVSSAEYSAAHAAKVPPLRRSKAISGLPVRRSLDSTRSSLSSLDRSELDTVARSRRKRPVSMCAAPMNRPTNLESDIQGDAQLWRQERRRKVEKMTRWLGTVVPAHVAAPDELNQQSAYMLDEQPAQSLYLSPRVMKAGGGISPAGTDVKWKRHSSFLTNFRNNRKDEGNSVSKAWASTDSYPLDSSSLSSQEHYQRARRSMKLDSMLGAGAGAAALRSLSMSCADSRADTASEVGLDSIGRNVCGSRRGLGSADSVECGGSAPVPAVELLEPAGEEDNQEVLASMATGVNESVLSDASRDVLESLQELEAESMSGSDIASVSSSTLTSEDLSLPNTARASGHRRGSHLQNAHSDQQRNDHKRHSSIDYHQSLRQALVEATQSSPLPAIDSRDNTKDLDDRSGESNLEQRRAHRRRMVQAKKLERIFGTAVHHPGAPPTPSTRRSSR